MCCQPNSGIDQWVDKIKGLNFGAVLKIESVKQEVYPARQAALGSWDHGGTNV